MKLNQIVFATATLLLWATAHGATITVTTTNDSGPGSLRAALAGAANGDTVDARSVTGSITLSHGELVVSNSVTILGPGPNLLAVDGNATNRVFHITNAVTAVISSLTTSNGAATSFPTTGLWNDHSTLTVSNCTVTANKTRGIYNTGTLSIFASTICSNSAPNDLGAGVYNDGSDGGNATLFIVASTVNNNSITGNQTGGGGIFSTGNSGMGHTTLVVSNCTFSGNHADSAGGAIYHTAVSGQQSTATLVACTFSGNTATNGGAILIQGNALLLISDTIMKTGTLGANIGYNGGTITTRGYNLSSDSGSGFMTNATDQINTDPLLGPLANNGGPTMTHALLPGSPAIDRGKSFGLSIDQRGFPRPVDDPCLANAAGGDGSDIGAFEAQGVCANLQISAITRETNSIRIAWTTYTGKTNALQWTAGAAGGSYQTNSFTDLFTVTNTMGTVTNYLDVGGATNAPARYYRVRLVP